MTNQEEKEHYGPGQIDGVPTEDAINKQGQDNRRNNEIIDRLKEGAKNLPDDVLYDEVKKTDPDFGYPQQESWKRHWKQRLVDVRNGAAISPILEVELPEFIQSERENERKRMFDAIESAPIVPVYDPKTHKEVFNGFSFMRHKLLEYLRSLTTPKE